MESQAPLIRACDATAANSGAQLRREFHWEASKPHVEQEEH